TLILGGTDANMVNSVWALALLVNHQDALKKAHDELDLHVGRDRQVSESDIKNLQYIQAIMKETLRLYSGPLSGLRESTEDCTVVPAGTRLIINAAKIQSISKFLKFSKSLSRNFNYQLKKWVN
ncbi:hypothetical protein MKX01_037069, partial [Papaver californicum]